MDAPLWTEAHAPALADLPQEEVRERLGRAVDEPMNLVLQGPPGAGKTAAVRALAREAHADPENDLIELNVADFFSRTKKEIRNDPRFEHFLQGEIPRVKQLSTSEKQNLSKRYKSDWSKADTISYVLKELASYSPSDGTYKTMVLDNAESIREDFQQALRRVMEKHHRTTQFVITTRQPAKLIPPIRSRCFPVPVRAPTTEETVSVLAEICDAEGVDYDEDGLGYVAGFANGNLRRAVLAAQTTASQADAVTMDAAHEALSDVGVDDRLRSVFADARGGAFTDARKTLGDLLDDEGYDGQSLLQDLLRVARTEYGGDDLARLYRLAGEIDADLATGTDDRLHLAHLVASWAAGR